MDRSREEGVLLGALAKVLQPLSHHISAVVCPMFPHALLQHGSVGRNGIAFIRLGGQSVSHIKLGTSQQEAPLFKPRESEGRSCVSPAQTGGFWRTVLAPQWWGQEGALGRALMEHPL